MINSSSVFNMHVLYAHLAVMSINRTGMKCIFMQACVCFFVVNWDRKELTVNGRVFVTVYRGIFQ
jgi:hypothetical protein